MEKNPPPIAGDIRDVGSIPGSPPGKIPWRRAGQTTPVFLPGEHPMEQGAFAGYDAWGCEELDTPEET